MPRQCCFLCASDEGVFLDITTENKQIYRKQFEICSLVKVPTSDELPTKLCHKCVYELNQCSNFVERFKRTTRSKSTNLKPSCSLCHHSAKSELIFDLNKDQSLYNSFDKVQAIFNHDLKSFKASHKYICLFCRYTIDLLFDLKNVSKETSTRINDIINEKIDYVNMPKVKTRVVSRKTTITESARTKLPTEKLALEKSDNDSTMVMRTRARINKLDNNQSKERLQSRVCNECQSPLKRGDKMYKVNKTQNTVCKKCWTNMGLDKDETENQIQQNGTETKVCKVFLKDVLKETELKEQKRQTVNKKHVVTEKSIENESKSNKVVDTKSGESKQGQKRSISKVEDEEKPAKDEVPQAKKSKVSVQSEHDDSKELKESEQKETETRKVRSSTRIIRQNSESDSSLVKRRSERSLTKQKQATGASLSDADVETKRNRKKLRNILEGNAVIKNLDLADESSSNDDSAKRKRRHASTSPVPTSKKSKTVSIKEPKSPVTNQSKTSQETPSSESDNNDILFQTKTYVCDECGASYENKLLGLTHKLTHYKLPKVKLEKMKEDTIKEVPGTSTNTDEQSKDQTEIAMRVDDDEEESANDTNIAVESTEDKTQDSKKDAMEDAIDMELVMKESDDDATDKRTEESQKEEEEVDTALTDSLKENEPEPETETTTKKQKRSSYDNNNKCNNNDVYESEEKESTDSKEKKNTTPSRVKETEEKEDKQNALLSDSENVPEEKDENTEEKQNPEKSESNVDDNNEKENEDTGDKATRTERKDSSEEEVISLGIWEPEPETTESLKDSELQTNSKKDVKDKTESSKDDEAESSKDDEAESSKDDKQATDEKKGEETVIDLDTVEQESSECVEIKESDDDDTEQKEKLNKTVTKSIISEEIIVTKESITIEEDEVEIESESISKSTVSKTEESNDCADAAAEVLREVIDLASAEVQKRQDITTLDSEENSNEVETLENISREIQNSVEIPPLN